MAAFIGIVISASNKANFNTLLLIVVTAFLLEEYSFG